jgi:hypothetical protein
MYIFPATAPLLDPPPFGVGVCDGSAVADVDGAGVPHDVCVTLTMPETPAVESEL